MAYTVSVVIPIYNAEKYIENCILSVARQTYKNFEVIIVNDGSPDRAADIAEHILKETSINYKRIDKPNGGQASARNAGIRIATGEFLVSIDADDCIWETFLFEMVEVMSKFPTEIAFADFQNTSPSKPLENPLYDKGVFALDREQAIRQFLTRSLLPVAAGLFIKRSFLHKYNLYFRDDALFGEDTLWVWDVMLAASGVVHVRKPLYNYVHHGESIMTSSNYDRVKQGYFAFARQKEKWVEAYPSDQQFISLILPRFALGIIHAACKLLNEKDFLTLCEDIAYRKHCHSLLMFPKIKIKIASIALLFSKKLFYIFIRKGA